MTNISSDICSHCNQEVTGDLQHSLLTCNYNDGAGHFLIENLSKIIHTSLTPDQIILLNFDADNDKKLPAVYLIASVLSEVWQCRKEKKPCHLNSIRASLEAGIHIMRKGRHKEAATKLSVVINN